MRLYAALFAIGLAVYGVVMWNRIGRASPAPHFVHQADAWLHGHASIDQPLVGDDWAKVETVTRADGSEVSGRRMWTEFFRTTDGDDIPAHRIRGSKGMTADGETVRLDDGSEVRGRRVKLFQTTTGERFPISEIKSSHVTAYMSFPPFPTLLMLPGALIDGRTGNDMIPTLLVAALILPLALLVLRRLAAAKLSERSLADDLWLVGTLCFGSVLFFSSVLGEVWYTAHVVGVALALVYAWASIGAGASERDGGKIDARRPVIAGAALACAALTRTAMAFAFPLFLLELWRVSGGLERWKTDRVAMRRAMLRPLVAFVVPIVALAIPAMIYNQVRFGAATEFGHRYLDVRQQVLIEQYGLASFHFLGRNLAVALTLLPDFIGHYPYVQISGHGLALWFTTPVLLLLLWPRTKPALHRTLWITTALVALPSLLYQNSGWVQFGYRFSLDYMVFLIMLLAVGGRPLTRVAKGLIVAGVVINLFGAITFLRYPEFYRATSADYGTVVAH